MSQFEKERLREERIGKAFLAGTFGAYLLGYCDGLIGATLGMALGVVTFLKVSKPPKD